MPHHSYGDENLVLYEKKSKFVVFEKRICFLLEGIYLPIQRYCLSVLHFKKMLYVGMWGKCTTRQIEQA